MSLLKNKIVVALLVDIIVLEGDKIFIWWSFFFWLDSRKFFYDFYVFMFF